MRETGGVGGGMMVTYDSAHSCVYPYSSIRPGVHSLANCVTFLLLSPPPPACPGPLCVPFFSPPFPCPPPSFPPPPFSSNLCIGAVSGAFNSVTLSSGFPHACFTSSIYVSNAFRHVESHISLRSSFLGANFDLCPPTRLRRLRLQLIGRE